MRNILKLNIGINGNRRHSRLDTYGNVLEPEDISINSAYISSGTREVSVHRNMHMKGLLIAFV